MEVEASGEESEVALEEVASAAASVEVSVAA